MMKKIIFVISLALLFFTFIGCSRKKCKDDANASIIGYDQTKGLCGTGFIVKIHAKANLAEKEYIVRELKGEYSNQIQSNSKFPISIRVEGKLEPEENCPNVLTKLEIFKPLVTCSQ